MLYIHIFIKNTSDLLQEPLQEWLRSLCGCDLQLIDFLPACYDEFTEVIMMTVIINHKSDISMNNMIVKHMNKSGSSVIYVQSAGLTICINPDCKLVFDNTSTRVIDNASTNVDETNDENSIPLIIGLVVGVLCGITILLLIIIILTWVIYKRYKDIAT